MFPALAAISVIYLEGGDFLGMEMKLNFARTCLSLRLITH